jgi:large subunit ribosomal protein L3
MPKIHKPRAGSLQYWPRKRASKVLPSANFKAISKKHSGSNLLGFIGYKVGMANALVKDLTEHSMTKGREVVLPVTIIECPPMKILSIRAYKNNNVAFDIISDNLDKELKKKNKIAKKEKQEKFKEKMEDIEKKMGDVEDIKLICYSIVKKTSIKKSPDIIEIGISGNIKEKIEIIKKLINKEINFSDVFNENQIIDVHGVTKAKGFSGPVKRFGISLKQHKSEKGRRRPGSLGPWMPSHVSFRAPMAGQLGFFSRIQYNKKIVTQGKTSDKDITPKQGFKHYGNIKTNYLIIKGSILGPSKRPLLLTYGLREKRKSKKQKFEFIRLI